MALMKDSKSSSTDGGEAEEVVLEVEMVEDEVVESEAAAAFEVDDERVGDAEFE